MLLAVACAAIVSACSALRLAYDNGAQLAWWWLDGYADFDSTQERRVKAALAEGFAWHRATQLDGYAAFLAALQAESAAPLSAERACEVSARAQALIAPTIDRALVLAAAQVGGLTERQFTALRAKHAEVLAEAREQYLQPDPAERRAAALKRAVANAERFYGRLGEAQVRVLEASLAASPFEPEAWLAERERRQRDTLETLRRLAADKATPEQALPALRALAERSTQSPVPAYRARQEKLRAQGCAISAALHNATTPEQRRRLRDTLAGWEGDLRAAMLPAAAAAAIAPALPR